MSRRRLGGWGWDVEDDQLGDALAALGVAAPVLVDRWQDRSVSPDRLTIPSVRRGLEAALEASSGEAPLWDLRDLGGARGTGALLAGRRAAPYARLWERSEGPHRSLRLAHPSGFDVRWLFRSFSSAVPHGVPHFGLDGDREPLRWSWPLRVTTPSQDMKFLTDVYEGTSPPYGGLSTSVAPLTEPSIGPGHYDLLLLRTDSQEPFASPEEMLGVSANLVIVFETGPKRWGRQAARTLASAARARALAIVDVRKSEITEWLRTFLRELSHDRLLIWSLQRAGHIELLFAAPSALQASPLWDYRGDLVGRLEVAAGATMSVRTLLPPPPGRTMEALDMADEDALDLSALAANVKPGTEAWRFVSEYGRATDLANLARVVEPALEELPLRRYAVVDVSETDATEAMEPVRKLAPEESLAPRTWYAVEVAISPDAEGLPVEGPHRPIKEPMQREPVPIWVIAHATGLEIDEPVRVLTLPPSGRSDTVIFHVRTPASEDETAVELRLQFLYRLNLIEDVIVSGVVVPGGGVRGERSLVIRYALIQEFSDLDAVPPKQMHIHVTRRDDRYLFFFVAEIEAGRLEFNGRLPAAMTVDQLASELESARRALLRLALHHDGDPSTGASATRPEDASELAGVGQRLWLALFANRTDDAMTRIGQWLEERLLAEGAVIQVTVDEAAGTFVFPWNLLYDAAVPDVHYEGIDAHGHWRDADAFWGLRYVVEQHLPPIRHRDVVEADFRRRRSMTIERTEAIRASLHLGNFAESDTQQEQFEALERHGLITMEPGTPIREPTEVREHLKACTCDLVWFFTHGHTARLTSAARGGVEASDFVKLYQGLERDGVAPSTSWRALYERIEAGALASDETWLEVDGGRVSLTSLKRDRGSFSRHPIVLLNMCESAQLSPSLTDGFIHRFLDLGAVAVVGTETSVPPDFAHHLATALLGRLLAGEAVGPALLESRRSFAGAGDLFGLAYSLYGSSRAAIEPPFERKEVDEALTSASASPG